MATIVTWWDGPCLNESRNLFKADIVEQCISISDEIIEIERQEMAISGNILLLVLTPSAIGHLWVALTEASEAELWYFIWSALELIVEQTIDTPVGWNAIALIMTSL